MLISDLDPGKNRIDNNKENQAAKVDCGFLPLLSKDTVREFFHGHWSRRSVLNLALGEHA